jgi:hypothetical protein
MDFEVDVKVDEDIWLRKFTLGNNGVEPTYEIMIEPLP